MRVLIPHLGSPGSGIPRYGRLLASALSERRFVEIEERDCKDLEQLLGVLETADCDVAHVQLWCYGGRVLLGGDDSTTNGVDRLLDACRVPLTVTIHDVHALPSDGAAIETVKRLGREAASVIVFSTTDHSRLRRDVPVHKLRVIPHFVEPRRRAASREAAKRQLGLPAMRVLTLLGYVYLRKGHDLLLQALSRLPPVYYVVFAGGPTAAGRSDAYLGQLVEFARKSGLANRLRITGYLPDDLLDYYLAATDLAVCPFREGSASGSISSWISVGKPILAADLPSIRPYNERAPGAIRTFVKDDPADLGRRIVEMDATGALDRATPGVGLLRREWSLENVAGRHEEEFRRAASKVRLAEAPNDSTNHVPQLPPNRFVLVSTPRSGTHMLRTLLDRHPEIECRGELFNDASPLGEPHRGKTVERMLDENELLRPGGCKGFVIHLDQGMRGWAGVWRLLAANPSLWFLLMSRRNQLARQASFERAKVHSRWQVWNNEQVPTVPPLWLAPEDVEASLHDEDERRRLFRTWAPADRVFEVDYEELCDDRERVLSELQRFLGVDHVEGLEPGTVKVGNSALREQIENYDLLAGYFAESPLAEHFRD